MHLKQRHQMTSIGMVKFVIVTTDRKLKTPFDLPRQQTQQPWIYNLSYRRLESLGRFRERRRPLDGGLKRDTAKKKAALFCVQVSRTRACRVPVAPCGDPKTRPRHCSLNHAWRGTAWGGSFQSSQISA
jgi:hypothetical protein